MSRRLINRDQDLQHLRNEGYNIQVLGTLLLLKYVPYVTENASVEREMLVSSLRLNGDTTLPPDDHTVSFTGSYPCNKDGVKNTNIVISSEEHQLGQGIVAYHRFSSKPGCGSYSDYYEKMTTYVKILSHPAISIDPSVTAQTFAVAPTDEAESVFQYEDTASSRAGISTVTEKLSGQKVAIIGMGGTGAYLLDMLAKTPVNEIHLYDGDIFYQHNAFRAPGAASLKDLEPHPKKVDYYARIYSRMHKHIIPHPCNIDEDNIDQVSEFGFVFLCLDGGSAKRFIVGKFKALGVSFIDCGIGVHEVEGEGRLGGHVRVTTVTKEKDDHVQKYIDYSGNAKNEYDKNIQIADLNALNAILAVIKWKKIFGFYDDQAKEHNALYTIDGNVMSNGEML